MDTTFSEKPHTNEKKKKPFPYELFQKLDRFLLIKFLLFLFAQGKKFRARTDFFLKKEKELKRKISNLNHPSV